MTPPTDLQSALDALSTFAKASPTAEEVIANWRAMLEALPTLEEIVQDWNQQQGDTDHPLP